LTAFDKADGDFEETFNGFEENDTSFISCILERSSKQNSLVLAI